MELTTNKSGEAYLSKDQFESLSIKTTTLVTNL